MQKTRMGYCPFSGLYCDREIYVVTKNADPVSQRGFSCRDMVLRPSAPPDLGAPAAYNYATGFSDPVSRQESPCHDMVPRQAGRVGSR